jgi:hypothetical protein
VLQDARQYLNIDPYATPHRKASFQSSNSAGSGEVPQWLAAAIRVTHTPRRSKSFHGDDEDKENVVYLNRASTSAFGPRTPSPTATLAQSAPTTPKRPEVSRPRALRASWNV